MLIFGKVQFFSTGLIFLAISISSHTHFILFIGWPCLSSHFCFLHSLVIVFYFYFYLSIFHNCFFFFFCVYVTEMIHPHNSHRWWVTFIFSFLTHKVSLYHPSGKKVICIVVDFLVLWSALLSVSLAQFKATQDYLTMKTAGWSDFSLRVYFQENFQLFWVISSLIFLSSQLAWWYLLLISSVYFPKCPNAFFILGRFSFLRLFLFFFCSLSA